MPREDGVRLATGRTRDEWFALLDEPSAPRGEFRQISDWLMSTHRVSRWWAQKLIVEHEQARGLRPPGVRPDGTFEVTATKTVAVPVQRLFDAFVNPSQQRRWLTDGRMSLRTSDPSRSARFDWEDGSSRVKVEFTDKGPSKSMVALAHARLPDTDEAERTKTLWKARLTRLKSFLES